MKLLSVLLLFFCFFIPFTGCKKEEIVVVEGNVAPPDQTIESTTIENYVLKVHIALLGRKATDAEFDAAVALLKENSLSESSRLTMLNGIVSKTDFFENEFAIMRSNFLNNADSSTFAGTKSIINLALSATSNPVEIAFWEAELVRVDRLILLEDQFSNQTKNSVEAHQVVVDNFVYDEINMGAENYVVSLFQNFLLRYPTVEELQAGKAIFEGKSAILFTENAKNRNELITVFFNSNEYYEGQVRASFLRFLYREPTSNEISLLLNQFKINNNVAAIHTYALSLDEYIGI